MESSLEREIKLDAAESFVLPALPGRALEARVFTSTYYDTPPRSLARGGITLRRRVENGLSRWQLKLPRDDGRDEIEAAGGPAGPPADLRGLLPAHLRHGKLEVVATLRTRRSGIRVADGERSVADVTLDVVDFLENGRVVGGFSELEAELVDGDDTDLTRLSRALRRAGAEKSDGRPKVMRVLELPDEHEPGPRAPAAEHLRVLLRRQLRELERHDPGVRFGEDGEAVHRFRVATRRTRALIRATRPLLGEALLPLAVELKWLTGTLGPVRDLDVLLEHLRPEIDALDVDRPGGETILAALQDARERARDELLEALEHPRYTSLLAGFDRAVEELEVPRRRHTLESLAAHAHGKLRKAAGQLSKEPTDAELHELRIRAKRARYAAELASVRGDAAIRRYVEATADLQDALGEHQDAVVAEERIRSVVHRGRSATAAGRLIERERRRRAAARAAYPAVLDKALSRGRKAFS